MLVVGIELFLMLEYTNDKFRDWVECRLGLGQSR